MKTQVDLRKINFIEEVFNIEDEDIILKLQSILKVELIKSIKKNLEQEMTLEAFNEMIDKSEDDFKTGKIISSDELKKKVQNWK